ncbi:DHA2 family efflux MFS transporter permease subunit [Streptococcus dysgalactiae]|uniref:DHA2 family efflux MFS transporter permease subunit n=2 Tax=Streptococcus dysgalactiae TaxID=1334 RepID=A0AAE9ULL6_STRDY|nr:DHA2 family efflux MFS transporter permease subunit [Streptococcus dysgalactiae]QGH04198.1 DHA2 family efflux MFS transporter permease subunit [Streptococcus dysgalactiae subsp. dysgalactiae]WAI92881.1 DHA2 family efflux MFS transporter permease subunit [Streptococcus dysgalactiae]WCE85567.1 DHA2 family efflux MFS transporter permease subunit [Streptococcus dysgalactiae]WCN25567.1 DHA2 family efflux MFS transporter permease subunit [Streptococcus dysgalactiae]
MELSKAQRYATVMVMMLGAFIALLNQTLLTTALPGIMTSFNLSLDSAQWLTTIFMLVNGIMIPISAYYTTRFSSKSLYLTAIGLFILGTLLCLVAPYFWLLLLGRAVQAIGAGILIPLIQVVLLVAFPLEERGAAMGIFGLVTGFSPAIGPTLSGWILSYYSWQAIFVIVLVAMLINIVISIAVVKNVTTTGPADLDLLSVVLSTFAFGGLLYGFSKASRMGFTNPTIVLLLITSFVALTVYFKRQKQLPTPMLNTSVLRVKAFVQACLIIMVMFMIFNASMTLMPIYIQNIRGLTALQSGLLLLPGGLLMGILAPITGRLFDKIGGKPFAVLGMLLIVVSSLFLSRLDAQSTSLTISFLFSMLMTGNALILTPLTTSAMNALPLSLIPHGSAMNSATRQLFAAIGTAIFVSLMGTKASLEQGFQFTYQAIAGLAFLGLFLALSLPRKH